MYVFFINQQIPQRITFSQQKMVINILRPQTIELEYTNHQEVVAPL